MQPAPNTEALDQQFKEFIQAIKKAVGTGIPHLKDDDPKTVDQAIADCKEILDVVMEGNVKEWIE
jgi:fumarate hydratase class II